MGFILNYKQLLEAKMEAIEGINSMRFVSEPKEVSKIVNDHQRDDNLLMLCVMPSFGNNSPDNPDSYMDKAFVEIMLLEKTDYSDLPYEEFMEQIDSIHEKIQELKESFLEDKTSGECGLLRHLNESSFQTIEVKNLYGCNGWNLVFTFDVER